MRASPARSSGCFRYSTTSYSTPRSWRRASSPRDWPQAGVWSTWRSSTPASVAQVVAGVPAGVLLQLLLVVVLRIPELAGGDDLGHDLPLPLARALDLGLHLLGDLPLLVVVVEDRRAILRADVVVLAV